MRVTNSMMTQSVIWNISTNLSNLSTIYSSMSSGRKYDAASDDPVSASKAFEYQAYLTELDQYDDNLTSAEGWLKTSESAVTSMVDVMERVDELALKSNNDTLTDDDRQEILAEIEELTDELIELANTDYAGSYIFAGYETDESPFKMENTLSSDIVTYRGAALSSEGPFRSVAADSDILAWLTSNSSTDFKDEEIEYPTSALSTTQVNLNGYELFGTGMDGLMATMNLLTMSLSGETTYKYVEGSFGTSTVVTKEIDLDEIIAKLDKNMETLVGCQTEIGARENSIELKQARVEEDIELYTKLLSDAKDADIAKLAVEFSEAESVYEASLSASAKLILPSLLNFL